MFDLNPNNMANTSNGKTLRMILSRRVVREFVEQNVLPDLRQIQQNTPTARNVDEHAGPARKKKAKRDCKIVDSNGLRPTILLDRLSTSDMKNISRLGYLQCIN